MKTTIELPDPLFRKMKATAAAQGRTMREFVTEALEEKMAQSYGEGTSDKPWMRHFGVLSEHSAEMGQIKQIIEDEFEQIEPEDQA